MREGAWPLAVGRRGRTKIATLLVRVVFFVVQALDRGPEADGAAGRTSSTIFFTQFSQQGCSTNTMISYTLRLPSFLIVALISTISSVGAVDRPNFTASARVKQHFHRTGDLIAGEEHLLKVIVRWNPMSAAEAYELCHNCNHILEETGEENGDVDGKIYPIAVGGANMCGGQACHVMPGAPKGNNKFHLRVKMDGEWSAWSNYQNFNVQEPGVFDHEEL